VQLLDVALVEVDFGQRRRDLGVGQDPILGPLGDEELDLLELLQIAY
jgi:hypothetical protein